MSFSEQLTIIKEQVAMKESKAKACIMAAEQSYVSAQSDMINEYKTIQESITASCQDYNEILECQNKLSLHLQHHDNESQNQSNTFAQVCMSLYTSILMGTMPAPLTQDIIDCVRKYTALHI